jgi:gluconolactonase
MPEMNHLRLIKNCCAFVFIALCYPAIAQNKPEGSIEVLSSEMTQIFNPQARVSVIAQGYKWAEGPVWVEKEKMLLFSDVPENKMYKWTATRGAELYLEPSGYNQPKPRTREQGSNGLAINELGQLVMAQTGNRQIAVMDAPYAAPQPIFKVMADNYNGKKFDAPNDLTIRHNGDIYFTDPPYGMIRGAVKDAPYQGVYKIAKNGGVTLMVDSITKPNGITLFPDEKSLLIANSDPAKPFWYIYNLDKNGLLINGRVFYDGREEYKKEPTGSDGVKTDTRGNVYATGPGGVWVFNKKGKLMGRVKVNVGTSNCAIAYNAKALFITAGSYVLKVDML